MNVELYLDPWNKPHGVVFFACIADFGLLMLFFFFLRIFSPMFIENINAYTSFLQDSLFVCLFVSCQGNVGLTELDWKQFLLFHFLEEVEQHWCYFLLNFW